MPRPHTPTQLSKASATATRPIYLIRWKFGASVEYLSCSGDITYDGNSYVPGINIRSMKIGVSASLSIPATAARVTDIQNSAYRGGLCEVWHIPAAPGDTLTFTTADSMLLLDGVLDTAKMSGESINVGAINKYLTGEMSPVFTFDQICNHIPPAGEVLDWEGEKLVSKRRRRKRRRNRNR